MFDYEDDPVYQFMLYEFISESEDTQDESESIEITIDITYTPDAGEAPDDAVQGFSKTNGTPGAAGKQPVGFLIVTRIKTELFPILFLMLFYKRKSSEIKNQKQQNTGSTQDIDKPGKLLPSDFPEATR